MKIEQVCSDLKEKIIKLNKIEKWYISENSKINSWYSSTSKAVNDWFKKETKNLKKWHDNISASTRIELNQKKNRLKKLDVKNLPRNKDNSISQRSNAGKEAVKLLEQIPKLEVKQNSLSQLNSEKKEKLKNEFKQKKSPIDQEKKNKVSILSKDKDGQIGRIPHEIKDMLKKCFNHYSKDQMISEKVKQQYKKQKAFEEFDLIFTNLKEGTNQDVVSDTKTSEILNAYFVLCKTQDFKIVFPNKNTFFNLLYKNEYSRIKSRIHYMRYYVFYIWILLISFVFLWAMFDNSEQGFKVFQKDGIIYQSLNILGFIAILLSCLWPIALIFSFFYNRKKMKIYKSNDNAFLKAKMNLDKYLFDFMIAAIVPKINQAVGQKCDRFISEITSN